MRDSYALEAYREEGDSVEFLPGNDSDELHLAQEGDLRGDQPRGKGQCHGGWVQFGILVGSW